MVTSFDVYDSSFVKFKSIHFLLQRFLIETMEKYIFASIRIP